MSLRNQISIRILLIALCILILGGSIAIWQARHSVSNEVDSSINLALQLIKLSVGAVKTDDTDWLYRLSSLEQTRHLNIQLKMPSGELTNITQQHPAIDEDAPPAWFINFVVRDYPKAEYPITTFDNQSLTLIIQANPLDEITEAWHESIAFFGSVLLLVLLTFVSVNLVFNKTLTAISTIVESLKLIETGNYQKKLPTFATQEYDSIARAINHMTDVLESTQQHNRSLTQHSLKIQEEERQHLSQELHDELGQSLTAIKVMSASAAHKESDTVKITTSIIDICDHLMTVVRSMMQQLHPLILTELGLSAALEDLVHHWHERHPAINFSLNYDEEIDILNKETTIQIYRVIQECLTNIVRHADGASQVDISLLILPKLSKLHLQVVDNGQGCHLDNLDTGFGLLGMKERIRSMAGEFELQSQPGAGMKISAYIPTT